VALLEVGERPCGIAVAQDGRTLYTTNGPSHDVSVVAVESRSLKGKVKAGERPRGIAYAP
jgi:YVTN family beta-propeller protein